MRTECSADLFGFAPVEGRAVVAAFDGGMMTSEAGAMLLGAADRTIGLVARFAGCFTDHRAADLVEHPVASLVGQRVFGIALGYEDLIDHDQLRHDPVMAVLGGKLQAKRSDCAPLAGKSTLNRLGADAGFAGWARMACGEANAVDFLFGLARNTRLVEEIKAELAAAAELGQQTGKPTRRFRDFTWQTRDSWSRQRRIVAKAEWLPGATPGTGEANPRFVVTSLSREEHEARHLYEKLYCARCEMEHRIKECQLDLYADRTSAKTMRANQLRLWFASMGYVLICALRRIGLAHTQFARASCGTIRLKLLKIGALVRASVRRIKLAMPTAFPYQAEYRAAHAALSAAATA